MYCFYEKKILLKIIIEVNYANTAQGLMTHLHNRIYTAQGLVTHLHNRTYPQSKKLPPYCLPFCDNKQSSKSGKF